LTEEGFTVDRADNGRDGLFHASGDSYDAIILDRNLPGMDGMAVLGALRAAQIETPVIILSAMGTADDRIAGLTAGSDDYLVKPFSLRELLARVRALFPQALVDARRITLAPPLARLACRAHPSLYTLLNALPLLRTHVLAWIGKAG
jgi:two-component system OmpR family response regulator